MVLFAAILTLLLLQYYFVDCSVERKKPNPIPVMALIIATSVFWAWYFYEPPLSDLILEQSYIPAQ